MKTPIKFLFATLILAGALFTACTDQAISPELPIEASFEASTKDNYEIEPIEYRRPDQVIAMSEGLNILSWTIKDDILQKSGTVESPTISLVVKDNQATSIYLTEGGLKSAWYVFEDHLAMLSITEDDIMLKEGYIDNVELRWVTEDIIIFLDFGLSGKTIFKTSFTIIEDIL